MCARAFPLLIHMEKCADGVRRVTEIREVMGYDNGSLQSQLLFEFEVEDNIYEGDRCVLTEGKFKQLHSPSAQMVKQLLKKGARRSEIDRYIINKEDPAL